MHFILLDFEIKHKTEVYQNRVHSSFLKLCNIYLGHTKRSKE